MHILSFMYHSSVTLTLFHPKGKVLIKLQLVPEEFSPEFFQG